MHQRNPSPQWSPTGAHTENSRAAMQVASPNFRKSFPFSPDVLFGDAVLHRLPLLRVGKALPPVNPEIRKDPSGRIRVTPMDSTFTSRETDGFCRKFTPALPKNS